MFDADGAWKAARNRLNHDWLKNKFLMTLEKAIKIANGKAEDGEFVERFVESSLQEFELEIRKAKILIGSFENSMSPRNLLDREPLRHLDLRHRHWLGQVVHMCWLTRLNVDGLVRTANSRLEETVERCKKLDSCFKRMHDAGIRTGLEFCLYELVAFRDACQEFGNVMSRFPSRIEVS
jgi:hypothetical protein